MKRGRIYIYPKDVMFITGKSLRTCQDIIIRIKRLNGKRSHQLVTFQEFADYMHIRLEDLPQLE